MDGLIILTLIAGLMLGGIAGACIMGTIIGGENIDLRTKIARLEAKRGMGL